jgi:Flp pilus assembly protein TadG
VARRRRRGDEGSATTEFVIAAPAFLLVIMLIVQAGLYFHALSVASAAAQEGARAATEAGNTVPDGEREAGEFVRTLAPRLLTGVDVAGQRVDGGDAVRVTVAGEVTNVFRVPGLDIDLSVRESAESVVERFRPSTEDPPRDTS